MNPKPIRKPSSAEVKAAVRKPSWRPTHTLTTNHGGVPAFHIIVRSRMVGRSRYP